MGLRSTQLLAGLSGLGGFSLPQEQPHQSVAFREVQTNVGAVKKWTKQEDDILRLLSDGHSQEVVASTLGVSPSAISQHLAKEGFRDELAARKSIKLDRYSKLDDSYDQVEISLLEKLKQTLPYLSKPGEISAVLAKINSAKRRLGDSSKVQNTPVTQIINITLPTQIVHKFSKTADGHVVAVDKQSLVTITSNSMDNLSNTILLEHSRKEQENDQPPPLPALLR